MGLFDRFKRKSVTTSVQTPTVQPTIKKDVVNENIERTFRARAKKKSASTGNSIYIHEAKDPENVNTFFNHVLYQVDCDEVLKELGLDRHDLKKLTYDDEIDQHIDRRKNNLSKSSYTLSPSEGEVADYVYSQLELHKEKLDKSSINAKMLGFNVNEMLYQKGADGKPEFVDIIEKPIEWFEPDNEGRLFFFSRTSLRKKEVDLEYKFMLSVHEPEWGNPKGKALLSRVYWLWFFKSNGWQFWSKFLERFGTPILAATGCEDPDSTANALLAAHNQSAVALPEGEDLKAISASGNGEAFKLFDDSVNRRIAKYLVGQTLTSGADRGGTYGQGKVHQEQQQIIFDSDKKFASGVIQEFIDKICKIKGYESPKFEWVDEKGIQLERAQRDSEVVSQGVTFDLSYYVDIYDYESRHIASVNGVPNPEAENYATNVQPKTVQDNTVVNPDDTSFSSTADFFKFISKSKRFKFLSDPANTKFSDEQQRLEVLADQSQDSGEQPIDPADIMSVIRSSNGYDDMVENLFGLAGEKLNRKQFLQLIEEALMVSDLLGYIDVIQEEREDD